MQAKGIRRQQDLAAQIGRGLSHSQVSRYISGEQGIPRRNIPYICKALGITEYELFNVNPLDTPGHQLAPDMPATYEKTRKEADNPEIALGESGMGQVWPGDDPPDNVEWMPSPLAQRAIEQHDALFQGQQAVKAALSTLIENQRRVLDVETETNDLIRRLEGAIYALAASNDRLHQRLKEALERRDTNVA